jgi:hypothetical protein
MPEIGEGCRLPIPIQQSESIYKALLVAQSGRPRILTPTHLSNQRQKGLVLPQRCQLGFGPADLPAIMSEELILQFPRPPFYPESLLLHRVLRDRFEMRLVV